MTQLLEGYFNKLFVLSQDKIGILRGCGVTSTQAMSRDWFRAICWVCHETYCSSWIMWIRGFVSTAYCGDCRSSSGGSVDLLSRTIFTTLIVVSRTSLMVGGFRSKPFQQNETAVQFFWSWLRMWSLECSLIKYGTMQKVYEISFWKFLKKLTISC